MALSCAGGQVVGRWGIELLVYGFSRVPGTLPEIMNVAVGDVHMRFRGPVAQPSFAGHDAVLLPFDTDQGWAADENEARRADLYVRTRVELLRAAAAGVTVGFVFEDFFAHCNDPRELRSRSLGAMALADLGLEPVPLPAPEGDFEVLSPAFRRYLRRFGIAESYLESRRPSAGLLPLCRTADHRLTGVASQEEEGEILFLPGDPRNRFLDFFTELAAALDAFRSGRAVSDPFLFDEEERLLEEKARLDAAGLELDRRLDGFRRRRELLALVPADPERFLPDWFSTFLGVELEAAAEPGCFLLWPENGAGPVGLLAAAIRSAADGLVALDEVRRAEIDAGRLPPEAKAILYATDESLSGQSPADDVELRRQAAEGGVVLLCPEDLLRLLRRRDRTGEPVSLDGLCQAGVRGSAQKPDREPGASRSDA